MSDDEIWKDVFGYEGYYTVNNYGVVKTVECYMLYDSKENKKHRTVPERYLKQHEMRGYKRVVLSKNGKSRTIPIHRIVAETFICPSPVKEYQVNHIDGNKANNHVSNLEWVTPKQNIEHAIKMGLYALNHGEAKAKREKAINDYWANPENIEKHRRKSKQNWEEHKEERIKAIREGRKNSKSEWFKKNREGAKDGKESKCPYGCRCKGYCIYKKEAQSS